MKRGSKALIVIVGVLVVCLLGSYVSIHNASGMEHPLSVIMSSSMQHDPHHSSIGTIDTGDVIVVQDPSRAKIESYVEGYVSGYKTFGDYGSVVIYNRGDDVNPCIHRAIVWLDYNGNGTWSAPSLKDYTAWTCSGSSDYRSLSGTLTFPDITQSHKNVSINLDGLGKQSGYLTMGDNPESNKYFDQSVGIISHPVGMEDIRSVALWEIPWFGVIKVYMTPSKRTYLDNVPNSIWSLVLLFAMIFAVIHCCDWYYQKKDLKEKEEELKRLQNL